MSNWWCLFSFLFIHKKYINDVYCCSSGTHTFVGSFIESVGAIFEQYASFVPYHVTVLCKTIDDIRIAYE